MVVIDVDNRRGRPVNRKELSQPETQRILLSRRNERLESRYLLQTNAGRRCSSLLDPIQHQSDTLYTK